MPSGSGWESTLYRPSPFPDAHSLMSVVESAISPSQFCCDVSNLWVLSGFCV
jgi:hypothetical protein